MRCAFFDWRDEVQKKSKKQDIELAALLFLVGLLLFIYPVVNQVSSYHTDEEEYEDLAMQFMPPEASPAPMLPIPMQTKTPTDEPPGLETQLISNNVSETESQESDQTEMVETPAKAQASSMPSVIPEYSEAPDDTEIPLLPTANVTAVPTAIVTAVPTKKPFAPTAVPTQSDIDLEACLAQNRDFVAWLTIPGTKINYPVVRSNNTEYYLHHLFNGKESKLGCLFSLTSSDYQTPSKNIAIYGHHISHSDAMFSTLMDYKDDSYCAAHSLIRVSSLYGERTYRVFAVLNMNVSDWDAATASFSNNESFLRFVNRAIEKSMVDTGVQVTAEDNILTLITCDRSYGGASGRLIVMAVQE